VISLYIIKLYLNYFFIILNHFIYLDERAKSISFVLPPGDVCETNGNKENKYYVVSVVITCNESIKGKPQIESASGFDSCNPTINMLSDSVCKPKPLIAWYNSIVYQKIVFSFICFCGGIFILFWGLKYKYVVFMFISLIAVGCFLAITVQAYVSINPISKLLYYIFYFFHYKFFTKFINQK